MSMPADPTLFDTTPGDADPEAARDPARNASPDAATEVTPPLAADPEHRASAQMGARADGPPARPGLPRLAARLALGAVDGLRHAAARWRIRRMLRNPMPPRAWMIFPLGDLPLAWLAGPALFALVAGNLGYGLAWYLSRQGLLNPEAMDRLTAPAWFGLSLLYAAFLALPMLLPAMVLTGGLLYARIRSWPIWLLAGPAIGGGLSWVVASILVTRGPDALPFSTWLSLFPAALDQLPRSGTAVPPALPIDVEAMTRAGMIFGAIVGTTFRLRLGWRLRRDVRFAPCRAACRMRARSDWRKLEIELSHAMTGTPVRRLPTIASPEAFRDPARVRLFGGLRKRLASLAAVSDRTVSAHAPTSASAMPVPAAAAVAGEQESVSGSAPAAEIPAEETAVKETAVKDTGVKETGAIGALRARAVALRDRALTWLEPMLAPVVEAARDKLEDLFPGIRRPTEPDPEVAARVQEILRAASQPRHVEPSFSIPRDGLAADDQPHGSAGRRVDPPLTRG